MGCENCHGPGALHVAEHTAGQKAATANIVNPARLSGWLSNNICMRCHQGKDVRVNSPGMQDQDFRPGMPLDPVVSVFKLPLDSHSASGGALLEHYYGMTLSRLLPIDCRWHALHQLPRSSRGAVPRGGGRFLPVALPYLSQPAELHPKPGKADGDQPTRRLHQLPYAQADGSHDYPWRTDPAIPSQRRKGRNSPAMPRCSI